MGPGTAPIALAPEAPSAREEVRHTVVTRSLRTGLLLTLSAIMLLAGVRVSADPPDAGAMPLSDERPSPHYASIPYADILPSSPRSPWRAHACASSSSAARQAGAPSSWRRFHRPRTSPGWMTSAPGARR